MGLMVYGLEQTKAAWHRYQDLPQAGANTNRRDVFFRCDRYMDVSPTPVVSARKSFARGIALPRPTGALLPSAPLGLTIWIANAVQAALLA